MIVSGLSCVFLAVALIPTFRLRTDYFAIGTLVVPVIVKPLVEYFTNRESFGVPLNLIISTEQFYYLGLAMAGITVFGIFFMMRSRIGICSQGDGR